MIQNELEKCANFWRSSFKQMDVLKEGISLMKLFCYHSDAGEILSQMNAGDFFGEIGILNLDGGVNK